jgi:hypothetical protein
LTRLVTALAVDAPRALKAIRAAQARLTCAGRWPTPGSAAGVQGLGLRHPERRRGGREQWRQQPAGTAGPAPVTSQVIVAVACHVGRASRRRSRSARLPACGCLLDEPRAGGESAGAC